MIPRDYEAFTVAADFARLRAGRIYTNDRAFDEFINGNDFEQILGDGKPPLQTRNTDMGSDMT
jgi:hypothetical protein